MKRPIKHFEGASRPSQLTRAALGFRAHSGWAAVIAVAKPDRALRIVGRSRFELAKQEIPRPVQPYHAAQKMELMEAEAYIAGFAQEAENLATQAIRSAVQALKKEGMLVAGCGICSGSDLSAPTVQAAFSSYPFLLMDEGELFLFDINGDEMGFKIPVFQV